MFLSLQGGRDFIYRLYCMTSILRKTRRTPPSGKRWSGRPRKKGRNYLHQMLGRWIPQSAAQIHANNVKRVIRALEFYMQTGEKISEHNERERGREAAYNACYFVLNDDRKPIYDRM